jgi:putative SOS response-associated peptidase YedK
MCGRFTLTYEVEQLAEELGVPLASLTGYKARYNIAPTDPHWVVRSLYEDREAVAAKWGLVNFWMTDRKQAFKDINARAETVQKSRAFREAFKQRRCVVPADGFFEWTGEKDARKPIWFHRPEGGLIYFAGLYESWKPTPDQRERTFTIITTEPNGLVAPIHDRMPVVLEEDAIDDWLYVGQEPAALAELLRPVRDDMLAATYVSTRVNSVKNDDPACLEPDQDPQQESLFEV